MTERIGLKLTQVLMRALHAASLSNRDTTSEKLTLIAVSKGQPSTAIETLIAEGHLDFGENYVQELLEKNGELVARGFEKIRWHFIGHLQTNKVKSLIELVSSIHSVDSVKLAREIARHCESAGRKLPVFIEVNIDDEPSKAGVLPEDVRKLALEVASLPTLDLQGLMCIPQADSLYDEKRKSFARLRELELSLGGLSKRRLSMGMSDDFEAAVTEGSTHIRVGSLIFGARTLQTKSLATNRPS